MSINNKTFDLLVDLLIGKSYDPDQMVKLLAKEDPEMFVRLATWVDPFPQYPSWMREVVSHTLSNSYVSAIKTLRTHSGMGLKEAKDVIDFFRLDLFQDGSLNSSPECGYPVLDQNQHELVSTLLKIQRSTNRG